MSCNVRSRMTGSASKTRREGSITSVLPDLPSLHPPREKFQAMESLRRRCIDFISKTLAAGFMVDVPPDSLEPSLRPKLPFLEAREARHRLFSRDARVILNQIDACTSLASKIVDTPLSTAVYCALATVKHVESFDVTKFYSHGSAFNRAIDMQLATLVGGIWHNLTTLNLKGCAVDYKFLETLASGNACRTLEHLNISGTFVSDNAVVPLARFENIKQLHLNDCQFITEIGIRYLARNCPSIEVLGLKFVTPNPGLTLAALSSDPNGDPVLPNLRVLNMEHIRWSAHIPDFRRFESKRRKTSKLEEWTIIPKYDYSYGAFLGDFIPSLKFLSARSVNIEMLGHMQYLRSLQLDIPTLSQEDLNAVATVTPALTRLVLISTLVHNVDFAILTQVRKLKFVDARIGLVKSFPPNLRSLAAAIEAFTDQNCANSFLDALTSAKALQKLHVFTADSDSCTAFFPSEALGRILQSLPDLEDVVLDRDIFGIERDESSSELQIPVSHSRIQSFKVVASIWRNLWPKVDSLPRLQHYDAVCPYESLSMIDYLPYCAGSMRSLSVRFEEDLMSRQLEETIAALTLRAFTLCHNLTELRMRLATKSIMIATLKLSQLQSLKLLQCDLPDLPNLLGGLRSLKELQLERCKGLKSLTNIQSPNLAKLAIKNCECLTGKVAFLGADFPCLEILSISQMENFKELIMIDLPNLYQLSLSHVHSELLRIDFVPNLRTVSVEAALIPSVRLMAPRLVRLDLDAGRTFDTATPRDLSGRQGVKIEAPSLAFVSISAEDLDPKVILARLKGSTFITQLSLPGALLEDLECLTDELRSAFPLLPIIECTDGNLELQPVQTSGPELKVHNIFFFKKS